MANITVTWDDAAHSIIRVEFVDNWTWTDYQAKADETFDLARSVPHRVDIIAFSNGSVTLPSGNALVQLNQIARRTPPNVGLLVMVTNNTFIRTLNTILFRVSERANQHGAVAGSLDEARLIIQQRRAETQNTMSEA